MEMKPPPTAPAQYRARMWDRITGGRFGALRWFAADVAVAAALLVASAIEIADDSRGNGWAGPAGLPYLLVVISCSTMLVRRAAPFAAAVVGMTTSGVAIALVAPDQAPLELFLPLVLVFYSLGALRGRVPGGATLVLVVGGTAVIVSTGSNGGAADTVPAAIWLVAVWVMGTVVRSRTIRTRELEDVTAQLVVEREERAHAAVVVERARIARELHDVVAHNVSVMVLHAQAGERGLTTPQPDASEAFSTIADVGRQTVDELRRLLGILREDEALALLPPPSLAHLDSLVQGVKAAGLDIHLDMQGESAELPTGIDVAAYRIMQEALTNALKHGGGRRADVTVRFRDDAVELEVLDEGPEAGTSLAGTGHGLVGMRERVALYGGDLDLGPRPGGGFAVRARLPLGVRT
jgi:signal transduction histidine kinase